MNFRQKNAFVTSLPNHGFKHGNLIGKIILLTENTSHTAMIILERTDWCAFRAKMTDIEAALLESLQETEKNLPLTLADYGGQKCCAWVSFPEALWVCGHSDCKFIIFFVSQPLDEFFCNVVDMTHRLKGSDSALFQIFPILFWDFRQNFRVYFLICTFPQERLDE
jgi:hypothetical protein